MTGNGGGIQQTATVTLTVTAQPNSRFSLAGFPQRGARQSGDLDDTTTVSGGFNSAIDCLLQVFLRARQ